MRITMGLVAVGCSIMFSTPSGAQISPQAQQLREQGLAAATQQDWKRAVELLNEAQKLAREDPSILYSLGTVYGKAGDDVPSMFWLKAYLLAAPRAPDVIPVTLEIAAREKAARAKEEQLYAAALNVAKTTKVGPTGFSSVADAEAEAGHIEAALGIVRNDYAVALREAEAWQKAHPGGPIETDGEPSEAAESMWMADAEFAMKTDDSNRAVASLSHIQDLKNLGFWVSQTCVAPDADRGKWERMSRQESTGHFLACEVKSLAGVNCQIVDWRTILGAVNSISDPALKAETIKDYGERLSSCRQVRAKLSPLDVWLNVAALAESEYGEFDIASEVADILNNPNRSFSDPNRVPGLVARIGSRMGLGVSRFGSFERGISR